MNNVISIAAVVLTLQAAVAAASDVVNTHGKNATTIDQSKIMGGLVTDISRVPSQVAILFKNHMICSGHIIDPKVVVTAAHCCAKLNVELLKIRSGSNYHEMHGRVVAVVRVTVHPKFVMRGEHVNPDFDVALMFLESSATATGIPAKPITLWNTGTIFKPGSFASLSGWGTTEEDSTVLSPLLRTIYLPIVDHEDCADVWGELLRPHNICAGYSAGGRSSCRGDSGAGLIILDKLAGINSFGDGCGKPLSPEVYSSVPAFRHWIWEQTHI